MPIFASPAPGKDRIASRRPPSQRVRQPLADLKHCNTLVDTQDAVLKKGAPLQPADKAEEAEREEVFQRRVSRGAGRYGGADCVRSSRVQGLKRIGLRQFEEKLGSAEGERSKDKQSGRSAGVARRGDGKREADAGASASSISGRHSGEKEVVGSALDSEGALLTGGGFSTPGDSEGDEDDCGEKNMPAVAVTSSPEFLRKLKGSPAGRACFAAGPLVGSGGNGGTVVRDRRKCKPRGVLIVGAERSLPSSPDDSKSDGNEKVPKRSVASVEWMVADEAQDWGSSSEVHTSAVDMSVSFQTTCETRHGGSFDNHRDFYRKEGGWEQLRTTNGSFVMVDADTDNAQSADKPLEVQEYQRHVMEKGGHNMCYVAWQDEGGDQAQTAAELQITDRQASSSSDDLDSLAPLQCSSPQVKGKYFGGHGRVKIGSDMEGDLVMGACESIKPADHAGINSLMALSPRSEEKVVESDEDNSAWPSSWNLAADGTSSSNGFGTVDRYRNSPSPDRGHQTYVVPTNSPESVSNGATRKCAYDKQPVKASSFIGGVKIEETCGSEKGAGQNIPLSCLPPSRYGGGCSIQAGPCQKTKSRVQATLPHLANGLCADGCAGLREHYDTKVYDRLPSAVLRKNKICKEKDLVRTMGAISQQREEIVADLTGTGQRIRGPVVADLTGTGQRIRGPVYPRALLGNRVRSLSGLLNSQEVRDELRSEDNSKLFRKKYPRRQPGQDIPENTPAVDQATHPMDQGELNASTTTSVEPGWKAFRHAECKMKLRPRGQASYGTYRGTTTQETDSESAGVLLPSRSTTPTSKSAKDTMPLFVGCRMLSKQQANLLLLSVHISHSLEHGDQDDASQAEDEERECPDPGWWKKRVYSNRLDALMQHPIPAISGTLLLLNAALVTYLYSRRLSRIVNSG